MKVIFRPYCNFATMGFSEIKLKVMSIASPTHGSFQDRGKGHIREYPSLKGERHREDEEHE